MRVSNKRYYNFPIVLLEEFMVADLRVFKNIHAYATYVQALTYCEKEGFDWVVNEDVEKAVTLSDSYFGVKTGDKLNTFETGKELFESIPLKTPKVGLSIDMFLDYYGNDKDDFQKVSLLGFLAIKSILQKKAYCKITNNYWLSRMDGKAKSIEDFSQLSSSIKKYANEYQTKKIKSELRDYWNLVTYARYTRGFYVSLRLNLEQLVYEAEKRRRSAKEKQAKSAQKIALDKALKRLEV
jgi:hypothetical protein